MTSIVYYFQVHQPYRVKPFPYDAIGSRTDYWDDWLNEDVAKRVAEKCYLPMNRQLLRAVERSSGAFLSRASTSRSNMGPVSSPSSIHIVVTPVSASPCARDH